MHIPILLCGFICGWKYGLITGFITPLLRSAMFTMPPMFPAAIAMAFELAAYGALTGLLYKVLPKGGKNVFLSLILSMLGGRVVWGIATFVLFRMVGNVLTWEIFISAAFVNAIPGIILQLVLIPSIVIALQKSKMLEGM